MKNLFNNQFGFSLVQGMVIASVVAGSGLVATRLITDQKLAQKGAETRDQIEELHQIAYSALQNRDNCKATFEYTGVSANITSATGVTTFNLPEIRSNSGSVLKIHGGDINNTYISGNVLVKSMDVTYTPSTGKADLNIVYERLNSGDMSKRTKSGYGAKEIRKTMGLRIQRNPFIATKPFESCYGVTSTKVADNSLEQGNDINKDLCLQMNGNIATTGTTGISVFVWDEGTSTCLPNAKCPDNMVYTGIESTGRVLCKSMADVVDMNTLITPTTDTCGPGKRIFFEASADGKTVQIRCTSSTTVDCSMHETPPHETRGCISIIATSVWQPASPQCDCRERQGDFYLNCNTSYTPTRITTRECRAK